MQTFVRFAVKVISGHHLCRTVRRRRIVHGAKRQTRGCIPPRNAKHLPLTDILKPDLALLRGKPSGEHCFAMQIRFKYGRPKISDFRTQLRCVRQTCLPLTDILYHTIVLLSRAFRTFVRFPLKFLLHLTSGAKCVIIKSGDKRQARPLPRSHARKSVVSVRFVFFRSCISLVLSFIFS